MANKALGSRCCGVVHCFAMHLDQGYVAIAIRSLCCDYSHLGVKLKLRCALAYTTYEANSSPSAE